MHSNIVESSFLGPRKCTPKFGEPLNGSVTSANLEENVGKAVDLCVP